MTEEGGPKLGLPTDRGRGGMAGISKRDTHFFVTNGPFR